MLEEVSLNPHFVLLLDIFQLFKQATFCGFCYWSKEISVVCTFFLAIGDVAMDTSEQGFCATVSSFSLVYKTRPELRG